MQLDLNFKSLDSRASAGALVLVPILFVAWTAFAPGHISRGFFEDLKLGILGSSFVSQVTCDGDRKASTFEIVAGMGPNRQYIRAYNGLDARDALAKEFPACDIGFPKTQGRPGWRKILDFVS